MYDVVKLHMLSAMDEAEAQERERVRHLVNAAAAAAAARADGVLWNPQPSFMRHEK